MPSALKNRLDEDIRKGKRTYDVIARSVARLPLYQELQTIKIDTTDKCIEEVVNVITNIK